MQITQVWMRQNDRIFVTDTGEPKRSQGRKIANLKARSDLRKTHAFTQYDREFSIWPRFTRA